MNVMVDFELLVKFELLKESFIHSEITFSCSR